MPPYSTTPPIVCSMLDCVRPHWARGLCSMHYTRWWRYSEPSIVRRKHYTLRERFEQKVRKTDGCWEWTASKRPGGYGQLGAGKRINPLGAHRVAYQLYVGPIPDGLCACHHCDNPGCVNPNHLFLGTNSDNQQDAIAKGRKGLPPETRAAIRQDYSSAVYSRRILAKKHGVSLNQVWMYTHDLSLVTAKMSPDKAVQVRRAYAAGEDTLKNIGKRFGICESMVSRIVNGSRWGTCTT